MTNEQILKEAVESTVATIEALLELSVDQVKVAYLSAEKKGKNGYSTDQEERYMLTCTYPNAEYDPTSRLSTFNEQYSTEYVFIYKKAVHLPNCAPVECDAFDRFKAKLEELTFESRITSITQSVNQIRQLMNIEREAKVNKLVL